MKCIDLGMFDNVLLFLFESVSVNGASRITVWARIQFVPYRSGPAAVPQTWMPKSEPAWAGWVLHEMQGVYSWHQRPLSPVNVLHIFRAACGKDALSVRKEACHEEGSHRPTKSMKANGH